MPCLARYLVIQNKRARQEVDLRWAPGGRSGNSVCTIRIQKDDRTWMARASGTKEHDGACTAGNVEASPPSILFSFTKPLFCEHKTRWYVHLSLLFTDYWTALSFEKCSPSQTSSSAFLQPTESSTNSVFHTELPSSIVPRIFADAQRSKSAYQQTKDRAARC